jgi:uncharacterized protein
MSNAAHSALLRFYEAEELFAASGRRDFAPVAATIHPAIVLFQPESLPYGGVWRGHDGFERWMHAFTETWLSVRPRDAVVIEHSNDTIISLVTMEAESRSTRQVVSMPMCQVIRTAGGLPVEWRNFAWDTWAINRAVGHSPINA